MSLDTGFPVIPVTFSGKRVMIFKSWDMCMIPKPFSKCTVTFEQPVYASEDIYKTVSEIDKKLNAITDRI